MNLFELFFLAVGLSMDTFAIAICAGLTITATGKSFIKKSLIIGMYFGVFQAVMPLIGYMAGTQFVDIVSVYAHWIAFSVLCFLGGKMIAGSFKKEGHLHEKEFSLRPVQMFPLAIATSIDALAVGVSFAFLRVSIVAAASFIGITTFVISMAGVKIGQVFGIRHKSKAELSGGVILALIGLKILLENV